MNSLLSSVYSAVLPSAPYVIAAYALVWVALFVFAAVLVRGIRRNERDLERIEARLDKLSGDDAAPQGTDRLD